MTTAFYITNFAVIVGCLLFAWGVFFNGRHYNRDIHLLRLYTTAVFTLLAIQHVSILSVVWPKGIEVLASQPIILLCIDFIILAMGGAALMGRQHYRNFALWILMLLLPSVFLIVNLLMLSTGLYNPLFDLHELLQFRSNTPSIFYGRMFFVTFLFVFWMLAACMLAEAYFYDKRRRAMRPISEDYERHRGEVAFIMGWAFLLMASFIPLFISSLFVHTISNLLLLTALLLSALAYRRLVHYITARDDGRLAFVLISRRVPLLLNMEEGGRTPWNTVVEQNPFFNGNPLIDSVAQALDVETTDISNYVAAYNTNFVAWISDQRLRHCAEQLVDTDRKILEVACACGYYDLSTFSRAFKRNFGLSPSEYRRREKKTKDEDEFIQGVKEHDT